VLATRRPLVLLGLEQVAHPLLREQHPITGRLLVERDYPQLFPASPAAPADMLSHTRPDAARRGADIANDAAAAGDVYGMRAGGSAAGTPRVSR
jgi:hypothetical protein